MFSASGCKSIVCVTSRKKYFDNIGYVFRTVCIEWGLLCP